MLLLNVAFLIYYARQKYFNLTFFLDTPTFQIRDIFLTTKIYKLRQVAGTSRHSSGRLSCYTSGINRKIFILSKIFVRIQARIHSFNVFFVSVQRVYKSILVQFVSYFFRVGSVKLHILSYHTFSKVVILCFRLKQHFPVGTNSNDVN